jgi:hypothetical protein
MRGVGATFFNVVGTSPRAWHRRIGFSAFLPAMRRLIHKTKPAPPPDQAVRVGQV